MFNAAGAGGTTAGGKNIPPSKRGTLIKKAAIITISRRIFNAAGAGGTTAGGKYVPPSKRGTLIKKAVIIYHLAVTV